MRARGIVWLDCDGVLTDQSSSWTYLHEHFGSRSSPIFAELYRSGHISYLDWMKIDIALMINSRGRPIRREEVLGALNRVGLRRGSREAVEALKRHFIVGIVSSGVDLLVKRVCREVGSDVCLCNELKFVGEMLIPGGNPLVPLMEKPRVIGEHSKRLGFDLEDVVYVGDSDWDVEVFKRVGLSIAIRPCGSACSYARYVVDEIGEVPSIVFRHYGIEG